MWEDFFYKMNNLTLNCWKKAILMGIGGFLNRFWFLFHSPFYLADVQLPQLQDLWKNLG